MLLGVVLLGALALGATGCKEDEEKAPQEQRKERPDPLPTADVAVELEYEDRALRTMISSLHVWILAERDDLIDDDVPAFAQDEDPPKLTCQNLIAAQLDPYDLVWEQRGEAVSDSRDKIKAKDVTVGKGLVYVEALNFSGEAELAACDEIEVEEPDTSITLELTKAGVSDCDDPEAEDGAPCDDGLNCTVGETCKKGECQGGETRDCTHVADSCNAESCDEDEGCVATPITDDTPCDDDLFCTENDLCSDGVCLGTPRDCSVDTDPCQVAAGCNEAQDRCEYAQAVNNTPCDDGDFCTVDDYCFFGTCRTGGNRDCSDRNGPCHTGVCDSAAEQCIAQPRVVNTICDDGNDCTGIDRCDSLGNCVPGANLSNITQCEVSTSCTAINYCDGAGNCVAGVSSRSGLTCNDDSPCTLTDRCSGTTCVGSNLQPVGTPCNDNDPTTTGDACNASGACVGTTP